MSCATQRPTWVWSESGTRDSDKIQQPVAGTVFFGGGPGHTVVSVVANEGRKEKQFCRCLLQEGERKTRQHSCLEIGQERRGCLFFGMFLFFIFW